MFEIKHDLESEVFESQLHSKSDFCVPKISAKYFGKNQ